MFMRRISALPEHVYKCQLIVQVQTSVAPVQDVEMTATIQAELAKQDLLPEEQIVDTGYVDAELLVSSQQHYGIRLVGPVLSDNSWQAKADKGFDLAHFQIDWHNQQAICPQGQTSARWSLAGERMEVVFASEVCAACPVRCDGTRVPDDWTRAPYTPTSRSCRLAATTTRTTNTRVSAGV
jgi:transposase